jgi:dTMP kinase
MHRDGGRGSGFFLTLEGPEGCGKSTQAQLLAARLTAAGRRCVVTREPGGTALGERIRDILLHSKELAPIPATDVLLFNAARAQLVAEVVLPALKRGEFVICDRFVDSTLAYQGYGAGQPLAQLAQIIRFAIGNLRPDLTILIDLPVEEGLRRKEGQETTRFEERETVEFHRRVRAGFLSLAAAEPGRFVVVDGRRPVEAIERAILDAVAARLAPPLEVPAGTTRQASTTSPPKRSEPNAGSLRMHR